MLIFIINIRFRRSFTCLHLTTRNCRDDFPVIMFSRTAVKPSFLAAETSHNALIEHCVSHLHEASDVRANYEISRYPYSSAVSRAFLWIVNMMWRKRESTSSRGHGNRIEFWLISRPDAATPPAFAALPGPKRILLPEEKIDARRDSRHVGRLGD